MKNDFEEGEVVLHRLTDERLIIVKINNFLSSENIEVRKENYKKFFVDKSELKKT